MPRMNPLGSLFDIVESFPPVDLNTAGGVGDWINLRNAYGALLVVMAGIGAVGEPTVTTLQQAKTNAGGTAKALLPANAANRNAWKKEAATNLAAVAAWADASAQIGATVLTSGAGNLDRINTFWVDAADLDINNGYYYVQASIADVGGTAQIGACFWIVMVDYASRPDQLSSPIA